jgi:DNA processing protein
VESDELKAWLRLESTSGVGSRTARKLLAAFGLPQSVFAQTASALAHLVSEAQCTALCIEPAGLQEQLLATQNWLQADVHCRRILTLGDANYPQALLHLEDPPILLYAIGPRQAWESNALNHASERCLAIVGSRNPTPQGVENAKQFAQALAQAGLTVVSGLALGVDGAAHEGALQGAATGQLATIAVVGTGLDRVYPKQHHDLAHRIAQRGIIVSEYALGTPPHSANFPKRNRIIAGLGRGTLVVEAAVKSGSLITARLATDLGREVFAIPGSIHSTQARGCHSLIKQGAKLVENASDILEELHLSSDAISPALAAPDISNVPQSDALLDALGFDPVGLDALLARTGLDTPTLQVRLMELEIEGHVQRLAGGLFQRTIRA